MKLEFKFNVDKNSTLQTVDINGKTYMYTSGLVGLFGISPDSKFGKMLVEKLPQEDYISDIIFKDMICTTETLTMYSKYLTNVIKLLEADIIAARVLPHGTYILVDGVAIKQ